jgi:hypothetical protein
MEDIDSRMMLAILIPSLGRRWLRLQQQALFVNSDAAANFQRGRTVWFMWLVLGVALPTARISPTTRTRTYRITTCDHDDNDDDAIQE